MTLKYITSASCHSLAVDLSSCQRDIDQICEVAGSWGLKLNAEKCVVLRFQRGFVTWNDVDSLSQWFPTFFSGDPNYVPQDMTATPLI